MRIENWKSLKEIAKEWLKELKNLNPNQEKSRPRFENGLSENIVNKRKKSGPLTEAEIVSKIIFEQNFS